MAIAVCSNPRALKGLGVESHHEPNASSPRRHRIRAFLLLLLPLVSPFAPRVAAVAKIASEEGRKEERKEGRKELKKE